MPFTKREYEKSKGENDFLNIGTGLGTKTLELYQIIYEVSKEMRPEIPEELSTPLRQQARPGDIRRSCLVIEKARKSLGWIPETDLREGIRLTFKWRAEESH